MDNLFLINDLRSKIYTALQPILAGKKCVLLEVPHHQNIGDILIWQGELDFLDSCGAKCLFQHSLHTFDFRPIPDDAIILLQGGGNFGDLWFHHHLFRRKVLAHYPHHKIIIFPVTVEFTDENCLKEDAILFAKHRDVTICARDLSSLKILEENYINKLLLLPDMAFCINRGNLLKYALPTQSKSLFFKRTDKELVDSNIYCSYIPENSEQHDWPTFENRDLSSYELWYNRISSRLPIHYGSSNFRAWYWRYFIKSYYIKLGVSMLSRYETIYTTRLHGAILSILLDKSIVFFNNSYGKNKNFYDSWLRKAEQIKFIDAND